MPASQSLNGDWKKMTQTQVRLSLRAWSSGERKQRYANRTGNAIDMNSCPGSGPQAGYQSPLNQIAGFQRRIFQEIPQLSGNSFMSAELGP